MKNKFRVMAVVVSAIISGAVFAGTDVNPGSEAGTQGTGGQVHFTGSVTDSSCNVDTNSENQNVDLGKWASSYFSGEGAETTKTAFHIKVSGCSDSVANVAVLFDGSRDSTNTNLLATTGKAAGVAIKLYEDDKSTAINLGSKSRGQGVVKETGSGGSADLEFFADYISTAATVKPGSANSTADFNMIYN